MISKETHLFFPERGFGFRERKSKDQAVREREEVLEFGLKRITTTVGGSDDWLSELRSSGHGDSMSIGEIARVRLRLDPLFWECILKNAFLL